MIHYFSGAVRDESRRYPHILIALSLPAKDTLEKEASLRDLRHLSIISWLLDKSDKSCTTSTKYLYLQEQLSADAELTVKDTFR